MDRPGPAEAVHPVRDRIADALGLPPGAFTDPGLTADGDAFAEMVRLWQAMDCGASRQAVLNVARALAAAQGA